MLYKLWGKSSIDWEIFQAYLRFREIYAWIARISIVFHHFMIMSLGNYTNQNFWIKEKYFQLM